MEAAAGARQGLRVNSRRARRVGRGAARPARGHAGGVVTPGSPEIAPRHRRLRPGRPRRNLAAARLTTPPGPAHQTGLDGVLADTDTDAVPVPAADVPGSATGDGLSWAPADGDDRRWWPQGVACLRGGEVLLVGWYEKAGGPWWRRRVPRSRVSVVDRSDPSRPRYRHVELVVPHRRPLGWVRGVGAVPVHAGGLAVVTSPTEGDLLLVADTLAGLRVFRLDDAVRVEGPGGGRWVLPQRRSVRVPLLRGALADLRARRRPDPLRFSFVGVGSVDGSPALLAGEYRTAGGSTPDGPPRLVRYRLEAATGLPVGAPTAVHVGQPPRMQGVAVLPRAGGGSTWYLSASAGHDRCGDLHVGAPGAWHRVRGALPPGCEDLDPADQTDPASALWGASEHPGRRWVFPVQVMGLHDHAGVGVVGGGS